jgi:CRISPR-associated endonuclease/helicase Cas3
MAEILAKSEPPITLRQHIEDGLSVRSCLEHCFPAAPSCAGNNRFWRLLWLSVVMHDLGKAHAEFQKVLRSAANNWKSQRHELFSLPFAKQLDLSESDKQLVLRVVACHHKPYAWLRSFIEVNYAEGTSEFEREFALVDIDGAISLANSFEKNLLPEEEIAVEVPSTIINGYHREVRQVVTGRKSEISDYFALLLLMGAFHHCDHLSSAFITSFEYLKDSSFVFLDRMKADLQEKGLDMFRHQQLANGLLGNVILTAPTGSGKTETAMLWLRNQLQQTGQGRVFYVLPFTASINAMFERLSREEQGLGKEMVGMLHGKLDAYLYESFFEEEGKLSQLKAEIQHFKQAFKSLQTPLKVITPFQLLKHLFGLKGFEKGIFEWVGGHFIFDEIHAYEPEVTAQIIVLLEYLTQRLQAKIFILTATLPTFMKVMIGKAISGFTEITAEPSLFQAFQRHRLQLKDGRLAQHLDMAIQDLNERKKVLIVCNTVDQARQIYEVLKDSYGALLIHGRFTAEDRARIEKELQNHPPSLLIGTQAIEVSLDIDYDVIYTEPAPLDALIQRFGRVNRKRSQKTPSPCFVFKERNDKDKYIYSDNIIGKTLEVLEKIEEQHDGVIQEIELQDYIDEVYPAFNPEAQAAYDKIYDLLSKSAKQLTPFEPSAEGEESYYRQFDGIKVLPAYYEQEFKTRLNRFDFIGAQQLKVSIRKNRFASFINTPDLELISHILFPSDNPKAKGIEVKYYKINKRYRPDIGLDFEKDEDRYILVRPEENIL